MRILDKDFMEDVLPSYQNKDCHSKPEFQKDVNQFSLVRKSLTKYGRSGIINLTTINNYIIILYNNFGKETSKIFNDFYSTIHLSYLKPFMVAQEKIHGYKVFTDLTDCDRAMTEKYNGFLNVSSVR